MYPCAIAGCERTYLLASSAYFLDDRYRTNWTARSKVRSWPTTALCQWQLSTRSGLSGLQTADIRKMARRWQRVDIRIAPSSTLLGSLLKDKHIEVAQCPRPTFLPLTIRCWLKRCACCPVSARAMNAIDWDRPSIRRPARLAFQSISTGCKSRRTTRRIVCLRQAGAAAGVSSGGNVALRLFKEGAFASFEDRNFEGDPELLAQYSKGLATVIERNYWRGGPRKARSQPAIGAPQKRSGQGLAGTRPNAVQITDCAVGFIQVLYPSVGLISYPPLAYDNCPSDRVVPRDTLPGHYAKLHAARRARGFTLIFLWPDYQ